MDEDEQIKMFTGIPEKVLEDGIYVRKYLLVNAFKKIEEIENRASIAVKESQKFYEENRIMKEALDEAAEKMKTAMAPYGNKEFEDWLKRFEELKNGEEDE